MNGKCQHCGMIHDTTCPRISAIEYHPGGAVKRIEFHKIIEPVPVHSQVQVKCDEKYGYVALPDHWWRKNQP